MGIFNRSIPTYTIDTANKMRITKSLPEEEPNTYIDDAFDPILNKAVRDRLIRQWGNPISATLAGYHEMLNNALVGSTKQWGPLGPGMGVLGSFGRTMDKGGDLILGTLTEGVKGVTGQGVESPFYNIFTEDEDYTGGKLLAAMGNSMAKLADAPELTEEDFGGAWKIPAIGIELATDPGILGGTLAKAGGAVAKRSSAEILQNLGKANNSVLADVGQLLSNYDDAMARIALDVTAPGTRVAIGKAWNKLDQLFQTSSAKNLQNVDLDFNAPPETKLAAFDEYQHDPTAQTVVNMAANLESAEEAAKLKKRYAEFANQLPLEERQQFVDAYKALQQYFGVDEPIGYIDQMLEIYDDAELSKELSELVSQVKNLQASSGFDSQIAELKKAIIDNKYRQTRDAVLAFNEHNYGKTRKAYDDVKSILRKTSEARKKATDELKPIDAMSVKDIPDSILELKDLSYKSPASSLSTEKPSITAKNFNIEFINVLSKMPGEDLRNFLKRNKISMKEYKARLDEINKGASKLSDTKTAFEDAVRAQREHLKSFISEKFKDLPTMPNYMPTSPAASGVIEKFGLKDGSPTVVLDAKGSKWFFEKLQKQDVTDVFKSDRKITSDAPFTISVSEHRLVNEPKIAENAVRYAENALMERLKYYGYPKKGSKKDFWNYVNRNPILRQAFISDSTYNSVVEDLKKMFKAKAGYDLDINFDDPNIRQQVLKFLSNHPEITSLSKGERVYIEGLSNAIFGKWDKKAKGFTYQNQFIALDQFTRDLEASLQPIMEAEQGSQYLIATVKDFISKLDENGKVVIDPEKVFKPQTWYTKELHDSIQFRLKTLSEHELNSMGLTELQAWKAMPKSYREAVNVIKNAGMRALGGTEVEALYQWAKQMQEEIFLPAKNTVRVAPFDYVNFKGETVTENTVNMFDTKALNNAIRHNSNRFKSIGDVKSFAKGFDVGFELKFKNLTNLTLEGSQIDEAIVDLLTRYPKNEFVTEIVEDPNLYALKRFVCDTHVETYTDKFGKLKSKTIYTLNEDLYKVLVDIVSSKSNVSIGTIISRAPKSVKDILPDKLSELFTSIDLAPTFVKPTVIKSKKTLIDAFYVKSADKPSKASKITDITVASSDNTVKQEMSKLPPSINAEFVTEPPTSIDAAKQSDLQAMGIEDIAEDAKRISEEVGGSPEDLPPEGREKLTLLYGKDKVDLFDVVNRSFISHSHAKYDKTVPLTELESGRKLSKAAETLSSNPKAADNLRMYDAISTAEHGDSIAASKVLDEIVSSGGYIGIRFDNSETKAIETLRAQLKKYTEHVNNTVGTSVLKVYDTADKSGTYIRIALDVSNSKKIVKAKFDKLKFADDDFITFEAPRALTAEELAFKESSEYAAYDEFAKGMTSYVQGIYKPLGFVYDNPIHIKHVKNDIKAANDIVKMMNEGVDSPELNALAKRLLDSDAFNHMYGTFGAVPFGKGLRGGNWRWNFGKYKTFDFEPSRVLNSTFAEGTLSNTDVQNFVGIFMSDNYKVRTFYNTVDDLKKVLYAKGPNGELSGNMANFDIIAPVYDANGKVVKFRRFDKTTDAGLSAALADENAVLVPSSLVASLDVWCKKNAKMSSRIYRFFNKMFGLPYKIGVLANPGFILGNVGDAYLKQATTMHMKYGTSMAEELVNVTDNIKDIIILNNKATDVFDKYLAFCEAHKITVPPSERLLHSLNLNSKARRRFVDFLNGKMVVKGSEVPVTSVLSPNEIDSMRLWLYLNNAQPSTIAKNSVRDFSKDEIDTATNNFVERIFYGKGKFDYKNPKTWGVVRNPGTEGTFYISEMWEAVTRSAEVLNDLKHAGYNTDALTKILSSGTDPDVAKKLHVDTVNAVNTMFNSNFNYEAQSNLMDKIGYAVPFPTFFLKNFAYWMKLLVENPEYIDSAITIQEGLWADREDEVEEDVFMAEAKGRGAVPINNGDEQGLSKFFRGIYKPTPLNSMFSAFNLLNHPIENLTNRVHPLINTPMQLVQGKLGEHEVGLATYSDAENVKYRPYSTNRFERNRNITDDNFNPVSFTAHKLNPYDRTIGNVLRFPDKVSDGDVQLSDLIPSVFQPDF